MTNKNLAKINCDVLRDLLLFAQFKKKWKTIMQAFSL